jgi:hypothetical protein
MSQEKLLLTISNTFEGLILVTVFQNTTAHVGVNAGNRVLYQASLSSSKSFSSINIDNESVS